MQVIWTRGGDEVVRTAREEFKTVWHWRKGTERQSEQPVNAEKYENAVIDQK